jgi:hypothetical protein
MADMFMPEMLWSFYFIQAQGYKAECKGLYQDNISTQLLLKNGKMLRGKRTKHIKAKFVFIKDRVDDRQIKVIDCATKEMWANIMTKPLQGTAFKIMGAELINCPLEYEDLVGMIAETNKNQPITASKMVTWKSVVPKPFKTVQECVGHNRVSSNKLRLDRQLGKTRHPCGNISNKHNKLGVARLGMTTWQMGGAGAEESKQ